MNPASPRSAVDRPTGALNIGNARLSRRTLGVGALTAGAAVVTGCGNEEAAPKTSASGKTTKVTFLTTLGNQGRDAYAWVAAEKGFFREVGLEVDVQPGKAGGYNHDQLQAGTAQFATLDSAGAVIRYASGEDRSFQILAAIHQRAVLSIVGLEDGPIKRPKDLEGQKIGIPKGGVGETLLPAYAKLAGFDASKVLVQYPDVSGINQLLAAGKLAGAALFVFAAPGLEAVAKRKAVVLPFSDHLTDLYGAALIAQKSTIERDPDLARRFTSALFKGLQYSLDHPQEAGQILQKRGGQKADIAAAELQAMQPYVAPSKRAPIGSIDETRMALMVASLEANKVIPERSNPRLPEEIVYYDVASNPV